MIYTHSSRLVSLSPMYSTSIINTIHHLLLWLHLLAWRSQHKPLLPVSRLALLVRYDYRLEHKLIPAGPRRATRVKPSCRPLGNFSCIYFSLYLIFLSPKRAPLSDEVRNFSEVAETMPSYKDDPPDQEYLDSIKRHTDKETNKVRSIEDPSETSTWIDDLHTKTRVIGQSRTRGQRLWLR